MTSDTAERLPVPAALPADARAELDSAVAILEGISLPARLAQVVGSSVEALKRNLPAPAQRLIDGAIRRALRTALDTALLTKPGRNPTPVPESWMHRGALAAAGAAGGALGLPGTLLELPVSTTLLLRQVAVIAAEQGEDLSDPAAQAECLKVFALGGHDPGDDNIESGYFAMRLALAESLKSAAGRTVAQALPGLLGAVAARFGGPVAFKVSAQAAPLLGAAAGAAVNLAFLEHYRGIAKAHFTVRRLERRHGAALVRAAYETLRPGGRPPASAARFA
ncbi:MAG: EcsC family protein [Acetobacteraceae bacterium]|nr:EcsC family protein [Acetobacteraceae bacterium]